MPLKILAVGPRWMGGGYDEEHLLTLCYCSALGLAKEYDCKSVSFPLISSVREKGAVNHYDPSFQYQW